MKPTLQQGQVQGEAQVQGEVCLSCGSVLQSGWEATCSRCRGSQWRSCIIGPSGPQKGASAPENCLPHRCGAELLTAD